MPANEHLTMQIASQVYKLKTAENALIFFSNGEPAYITKRFDYAPDGLKIQQEDLSSLAGKSKATHGEEFKYTGSYEDAAALISNYVTASKVEISKFFSLVVFNYLFSNGDAHLKNFSVQQTSDGDYILAPAYDLLNTSIHVNDDDFALKEGLLPREYHSIIYRSSGHPCRDDFAEFGRQIGVLPKKIESIIETFATEQQEVYNLIQERLRRFQRRDK